MPEFIKGVALCESFFFDVAEPLLSREFPGLKYSAGLLGYGSDVLGYDDVVSRDHMWGPRFYLFLNDSDKLLFPEIEALFAKQFPYEYKGFSVNFSPPNPNDSGVRIPQPISSGEVWSLVEISTFDEFSAAYLGKNPAQTLDEFDWLSFSEHRLLGLTSGRLFVDQLDIEHIRRKLCFYPPLVKCFLISSQWAAVAEEQAFVKRCSLVGDELGSRLVCARQAERLMRLCFLYTEHYAPYSKWFGTAFSKLEINSEIKGALFAAVCADTAIERERHLLKGQLLVAELHNASGLTESIDAQDKSYYGRDIRVIFAERFADAVAAKLKGTPLEFLPLIGSFSGVGNLEALADDPSKIEKIKAALGALREKKGK